MSRTGLFIGRFQPLHIGHVAVIEKALSELDSLIVGIGSAEKHHTAENPYTCEERKAMIESSVKGISCIVPIPDINDYSSWVKHVKKLAGEFDVVYSGNEIVNKLFEEKGYAIERVSEIGYISSSAIRDMMVRGGDWEKFVPKPTADIIQKINGEERVRALYKQYLNPIPAVDMIIKYNNGIVLVKRRDGKYALPGGFMEFGESAESAAIRETKEETGLDLKLEKLLGVYSDPKRDPRTHIISITFVGSGSGELKAGSDAKETMNVPIEDALEMELTFDHKKILEDYIKKGFYETK